MLKCYQDYPIIPAKMNKKTKIKKRTNSRLIIALLAIFIILPTNFSSARTFNPNQIITDQELLDKNSLTKTAIQKFLERESSVLARYSQIIEGQTLKASEMIWLIAQKHNINPKFLLTTLEKEQALISKTQATEKALDWATGYSCYNNTCKEKYRGFYNQVEATAETQQIYRQKAGQFSFQVGQATTTFDGFKLTPQSQATANLYIYTPYVGHSPELGISSRYGGNRLFWRIWHRYFSNQKFLDGQVVTYNGDYWRLENNQKRKFASLEIFNQDYATSDAINVSAKDLASYPEGPTINFASNTLVKSDASGQIFLLSANTKRPIIDNAALALLSDFNIAITESEVPTVSEDQLASYNVGTLISSASIYPQGKLFQSGGQTWLVQDNLKHAVDSMVWQNRFDGKTPESINDSELDQYPTGEPIKLKDGTFVYADGKYYLISAGERMKIDNETIFNFTFGTSKKESALRISQALLEIHGAGEIIDYIDDTIQDSAVENPAVPIVTLNYAANFVSLEPESLILATGQTQALTLKFKNLGATAWQTGNVWLQINDKDSEKTSFGAAEKINFSESSVSQNQVATFQFDLTAPTQKSGLLTQEFSLYANISGTPQKIASITKFIIVKPGTAAQILEHNIPVAVKNTWRPITVKMKIKNLSPDQTWLSRKTALEIYDLAGGQSDFYDPNDWVRQAVAAVPVNANQIKPGETGEFNFTLDPRGLKRGTYILNFKLKMLDKDKEVLLNGQAEWYREIRVD